MPDEFAFTFRGTLISLCRAARQRAPSARRLAGAGLYFLLGLGTGIGISASGQGPVPKPAQAEPLNVQPVRGSDTAADVPTLDPAPPRPLDAGQEPPPRDRENPSAREVAERALAVSAFVRGGGVYGAGVVIEPRYVLTCLHVVEPMKQIRVTTAGGVPQPARIVDRDGKLDLAVLELETPSSESARLASAFDVRMGDTVFAMGAPRRMTFSLGRGIVSFVGRTYDGQYYLQTDIATNSGSSGGPVLDELGRVIAVSSFILRDSHGLAFAMPIDHAYRRFEKYFEGSLDSGRFERWLAAQSTAGQPKLVSAGP